MEDGTGRQKGCKEAEFKAQELERQKPAHLKQGQEAGMRTRRKKARAERRAEQEAREVA